MRDVLWLVCTAQGIKATRKKPPNASDLGLRERAVKIVVEIPAEAFAPPGIPTATIAIPADALTMPAPTVTVDVPGAPAVPVDPPPPDHSIRPVRLIPDGTAAPLDSERDGTVIVCDATTGRLCTWSEANQRWDAVASTETIDWVRSWASTENRDE
jgi:hypothetical protein